MPSETGNATIQSYLNKYQPCDHVQMPEEFAQHVDLSWASHFTAAKCRHWTKAAITHVIHYTFCNPPSTDMNLQHIFYTFVKHWCHICYTPDIMCVQIYYTFYWLYIHTHIVYINIYDAFLHILYNLCILHILTFTTHLIYEFMHSFMIICYKLTLNIYL